MNREKRQCCGNNNNSLVRPSRNSQILQQEDGCMPVVSADVCIEADVTIAPMVTPGTPVVNCIGDPFLGTCEEAGFEPSPNGTCTFTVSQVLCINIPLTFEAEVEAVAGDVACGNVFSGPGCENGIPGACTLSRGFFANNEEAALLLLAEAGGEIVLGMDGEGFSLTVTAANIDAVLEGNAPGAPSPQYAQLYSQLLTANLNVINGATCPFATNTINLANMFLAESEQDDVLASSIQELLESYNTGEAPGCPDECVDEA